MDEDGLSRRSFGFCAIDWKITNFFAATGKEKWVIESPAFTINGKIPTKWRFFLKVSYINEKYVIYAYLLNKDGFSQEPILVSWKLFFPYNISSMRLEVESDFERKKSVGMEICNLDYLESIMRCNNEDTLILRSMIFVCSKDNQPFKRSKNVGLKYLSQDLCVMYKVGRHYDIKLDIGGFAIKAHKGILSFRNDILRELIEKEDEVKLPELDIKAAYNVIGYLYTGNLDYVLRKPSFAMLHCIKYLNIKELEEYYVPDEYELCSVFRIKECSFECIVPVANIAKPDGIINSLYIKVNSDSSGYFLTLHLYPENASDKRDNASIFIENITEKFPDVAYIEIAVLDLKEKPCYSEKRRCSNYTAEVNFESFFSRDILKDTTLTDDGNLRLLCNFYSPTGSRMLLTTKKRVHSININPEKHFEMISNTMTTLFSTGIYSDFTLLCNGKKLKVHSYVLIARSNIFRNFFKSMATYGKTNLTSLDVSHINESVLESVLHYMYTGKFEFQIENILQIYEVSERFYMLPLKYASSVILQTNMAILDTGSVLRLAKSFKDYKLIALLENFINEKSKGCVNVVGTSNSE